MKCSRYKPDASANCHFYVGQRDKFTKMTEMTKSQVLSGESSLQPNSKAKIRCNFSIDALLNTSENMPKCDIQKAACLNPVGGSACGSRIGGSACNSKMACEDSRHNFRYEPQNFMPAVVHRNTAQSTASHFSAPFAVKPPMSGHHPFSLMSHIFWPCANISPQQPTVATVRNPTSGNVGHAHATEFLLARNLLPGTVPYSSSDLRSAHFVNSGQNPSTVKKYKCDVCHKAFSRSNTLVTHKRIHSGEKPFVCEHCGRAFRQPGNLTRHRLTHTTVKPYACEHCGKAFNRASNLHTHARTHSSFKPFVCHLCGKGYYQRVDLRLHMRVHINDAEPIVRHGHRIF